MTVPGAVHPLRAVSRGPLGDDRIRIEWLALLIVAAIAGPYLAQGFGLRTEQVVIYTLGFGSLLAARGRIHRAVSQFAPWWVAAVLVALSASVGSRPPHGYESGSLLAGLDNLLLPLAALSISNVVLVRGSFRAKRFVITFAYGVVVLMAVNSALSGASLYVDLQAWLQYFWSAGQAAPHDSVAVRAATLGRQTGIFNQPLEAGAAYSIGLSCVWYLHDRRVLGTRGAVAFGVILTFGGLLTVSKVFILGGLPLLAVGQMLATRRKVRAIVPPSLLFVLAWLITTVDVAIWKGQSLLEEVVTFGQGSTGWLAAASGNRFVAESTLSDIFRSVWTVSPFTGLGVAGIAAPYDSGYLEIFVLGGTFGVAAFVGLILAAWLYWRRADAPRYVGDRGLALYVLSLVTVASVGAPILTMNRVGVMVWVLLPITMGLSHATTVHTAPQRVSPRGLAGPPRHKSG